MSINQALLERTGYTLDVTTGQRKYGGPPPESVHPGAQPTIGTEVKIISFAIVHRMYSDVYIRVMTLLTLCSNLLL